MQRTGIAHVDAGASKLLILTIAPPDVGILKGSVLPGIAKFLIAMLASCTILDAGAGLPTCGPHIETSAAGVLGPDGDYYLIESHADVLIRVDSESGLRTLITSGSGNPINVEPADDLAFESNGDILLTRYFTTTLLRVNPTTGQVSTLPTDIPGNEILDALHVAADGTIFVGSASTGAIYRVDPTNGSSAVVASASVGTGPALLQPIEIRMDDAGRLVVLDFFLRAIVRVDPVTGDRDVLSGPQDGAGPNVGSIFGLWLRDNGNFITSSIVFDTLVEVDGVTGDRTLLAIPPYFAQTFDRVVDILDESDDVLTIAIAANSPYKGVALVALDLTANSQSFVTRSGHVAAAAVTAGGETYSARPLLGAVYKLNSELAIESIVADESLGNGPALYHLDELVADGQGRLLYMDFMLNAILELDPLTGHRSIVSGAGVGGGVPTFSPRALAVAGDGNLYAYSAGDRGIFAVNRQTGDRSVIANDQLGQGVALTSIRGIAMEDENHLLATQIVDSNVLRIDLTTGDRQVISGPSVGNGPDLDRPVSIVVRADGTAFVKGARLTAVDLATGDRVQLADDNLDEGESLTYSAIDFLPDGRLLATGRVEFPAIYATTQFVARETVGDADGDRMGDFCDNCTSNPNHTQFDGNLDGFGNHCDADLNDDCIVNAADLGLLKQVFFGSSDVADLNVDGQVNAQDLGRMRSAFFAAPGPSAAAHCD